MGLILITLIGVVFGYLVGMYHRWLEEDCKFWEERDKHLYDRYLDPQFD